MTPDAATIILTALTTGAAAATSATVENVVKDAYTGLKELVKKRFNKVPVQDIEDAPDDEDYQKLAKTKLEKAFPEVAEEVITEVLEKAQEVLKAIEENAPEVAETVGISLQDVKAAASVRVKDIDVKGTGVNITMQKIHAGGDVDISGIKVDTTKK